MSGPARNAPEWVILALKLALSIAGLGGAYLGGHVTGEEDLEQVTFRALEAEAERNDRLPVDVSLHFVRMISELQGQVAVCDEALASCQQGGDR